MGGEHELVVCGKGGFKVADKEEETDEGEEAQVVMVQ